MYFASIFYKYFENLSQIFKMVNSQRRATGKPLASRQRGLTKQVNRYIIHL